MRRQWPNQGNHTGWVWAAAELSACALTRHQRQQDRGRTHWRLHQRRHSRVRETRKPAEAGRTEAIRTKAYNWRAQTSNWGEVEARTGNEAETGAGREREDTERSRGEGCTCIETWEVEKWRKGQSKGVARKRIKTSVGPCAEDQEREVAITLSRETY